MVSRFSRWPSRRPSWIAKRKDLSNSESLFCSKASHQVSAQSNLQFGRCHLKNFKMAAMLVIFDIIRNNFSNSESLALMPPIKFLLNPTYNLEDVVRKNFKMASVAAILDIGTE